MAQPARADEVTPPTVPASIEVPAGNTPFLVGHAVGTQNYACMPLNNGVAWTLYTPQATLFSDSGAQITTHFFSPNPLAPAEFLPTWQHSMDTSAVWVKAAAAPYIGSDVVEPGAIAWLLLKVVTSAGGPTGGDELTADHIHPSAEHLRRRRAFDRLLPPARPRQEASVPYTADYYFYMEASN